MGSKELVKKIKEMEQSLKLTNKEVEQVVDALFLSILETVKAGEKVSIQNFGIFKRVDRKERTSRNPKTGEPIKVPAKKSFTFTASKYSKNFMN